MDVVRGNLVRGLVSPLFPVIIASCMLQTVSARAQDAGAATMTAPPSRLGTTPRAVDLDASADYYRGYRDGLRDAARVNRSYYGYRYRSQAGTGRERAWPARDDRRASSGNGQTRGQETATVWPPQPAAVHAATGQALTAPALHGQQRPSPGGDRATHPLPMPSASYPQGIAPQPPHAGAAQAMTVPSHSQFQSPSQSFGPSDRPR